MIYGMQSAEVSTDPETGEELEKILLELPVDHWSGNTAERVWAKPLGNREYEVRNTPWYAQDVNWGDVVRCEGLSLADLPIVREVVRPGGHRTLRAYFLTTQDSERDAILDELMQLGAMHENADGKMYSLDLEPDVDLDQVVRYLKEKEAAGVLGWETGWSTK